MYARDGAPPPPSPMFLWLPTREPDEKVPVTRGHIVLSRLCSRPLSLPVVSVDVLR